MQVVGRRGGLGQKFLSWPFCFGIFVRWWAIWAVILGAASCVTHANVMFRETRLLSGELGVQCVLGLPVVRRYLVRDMVRWTFGF